MGYLREYQRRIINDIVNNPFYGVFLDCGLGKTLITLSAINILLKNNTIQKVLIIAPLQVIYNVWPEENNKWEFGFKISNLHKNKKNTDADILLINPEGIGKLDFSTLNADMLIVDESTKFKNYSSKRFKTLKNRLYLFKRRLILTGTPAPKGLIDLWSQVYILDKGERLGKYITHFRNKYFYISTYSQYVYNLIDKADKQIINKITDIVKFYRIKHNDFNSIINTILCILPNDIQLLYKQFIKDSVIKIDTSEIHASNKIAKLNKLRQISSGICYNDNNLAIALSRHKLESLNTLLENLGDQSLLIIYNYNIEVSIIQSVISNHSIINGRTSQSKRIDIINKWNNKKIQYLILQAQTLSHGVNLQSGGHNICWFSPTYDLEVYKQMNARLIRSGQNETVLIHHLVTKNTIEPIIYNILSDKADLQEDILLKLIT